MKYRWMLVACMSIPSGRAAVAATIHVPADQPTIQAGIDAALTGDTVLVAAGTYTGPGNRDISFNGKGIVVKSAAGPALTIIDCQGSLAEPHRGFHFFSGEDSMAVLSGFTIRNGHTPGDANQVLSVGGGILCEASSPTITNCVLKANWASNYGGGMACLNGSFPRITHCRFEGNHAHDDFHMFEGWGGALRCVSSAPKLRFCTFVGDSANFGGAISCDSADIEVSHCTFVDNVGDAEYIFEGTSSGSVGAIHVVNYSSPYLAYSTFVGNVAQSNYGDLAGRGGAIRVGGFTKPMIVNCTFYANAAMDAPYGRPGEGGAISPTYRDKVIVQRCIIADTPEGEAVKCYAGDTLSQKVLLCSDLFGNAGGDWIGCIADQAATNGNLSADPLFCDAATGDFSLQPLSPCAPLASGCGLIGAWPVGCTASIQDSLWLKGEDLTHVVNDAPLLRWAQSQVTSQTEYAIEVGSDADWTTAEMWQPGVISGSDTAAVYSGAPPMNGLTYYARARAGDGSNWSDWFETSFTMNSPPAPPTQVSPVESAVLTDDQPTLKVLVAFDAESDSQQVHFRVRDVAANTVVVQSPFIPSGGVFQGDTVSWQVSVPLQENHLYQWSTRATDGHDLGASSQQFFWLNAVDEWLAAPALFDPTADAIVYSSQPSFAWSLSVDPDPLDTTWYEWRLAEDSDLVVTVAADSLADTALTLTGPLDVAREFWWQVTGHSSDGQAAPSSVERFRTYLPGDVNATWTLTSADIIALVNYVFRGQPLAAPECAGRTNGDGAITAADIIWLVNTVFKSGPLPVAGCG